jgi:FKBP-type peptidyl-prolyl cis-trans isomerase FkpA
MEPLRFRPRLQGMEDRVTPAVSSIEVLGAAAQTRMAAQTLRGLFEHLSEPMNVYEKPFWSSFLPGLMQQSQQSSAILAEFGAALQAQFADNKTLAAELAPWAAQTAALKAQADTNAAYAGVYAVGFGVPVSTVFPPPPPASPPPSPFPEGTSPFPDNNPTTPPVTPPTSDDSGMSNTLPPLDAPNWVAQPSGLKTWDVTTGVGAALQVGNQFTAQYTGWLTDGTVFDSTRPSLKPGAAGTPVSFTLDTQHLIAGWVQGLPGLKPGGIRRLIIPPALAYGNNPPPGSNIPPGATLVFEVKLVSVTG